MFGSIWGWERKGKNNFWTCEVMVDGGAAGFITHPGFSAIWAGPRMGLGRGRLDAAQHGDAKRREMCRRVDGVRLKWPGARPEAWFILSNFGRTRPCVGRPPSGCYLSAAGEKEVNPEI